MFKFRKKIKHSIDYNSIILTSLIYIFYEYFIYSVFSVIFYINKLPFFEKKIIFFICVILWFVTMLAILGMMKMQKWEISLGLRFLEIILLIIIMSSGSTIYGKVFLNLSLLILANYLLLILSVYYFKNLSFLVLILMLFILMIVAFVLYTEKNNHAIILGIVMGLASF